MNRQPSRHRVTASRDFSRTAVVAVKRRVLRSEPSTLGAVVDCQSQSIEVANACCTNGWQASTCSGVEISTKQPASNRAWGINLKSPLS